MEGHLIFCILLLGAHYGLSLPHEHQRIINGNLAVAKQFPYQVFYDVLDLTNLTQNTIEWKPNCGGTLISKRIILTAAHCFKRPNIYAIKVYFGAVDKSNKSEIGQQQLVVKRANVVVHEEYDTFTKHNDIALIKLPVDVAFDEYIRPAKLPKPDIVYSSEATASGWGAIKDKDTEDYDPKLKYFDISILSHAECKEQLKNQFKFLPPSKICIAPSKDTLCKGDSGGPLTVRHKGDFVVLGIAFSSTCSINNTAVFERVTSYLNWIHENAGAHNLDV